MPIQIQAPDGSIAEFPDGTPDDVIEGVMQKEFGGPQPMAWSDVGKQALENTPESAYNFGASLVHPFMHPMQTVEALGDLGAGTIRAGAQYVLPESVFNAIDSVNHDSAVKAGNTASAVGNFYKDRYGSVEGFKRGVASDPIGVAGDISTVLTGGATAARSLLGAGSKTARVLDTAARVSNPLTVPATAAKVAGKVASGTAKTLLGVTTGTSADTIGEAYSAGLLGGKQKKAFTDNMRGAEDQAAAVEEAKRAVGQIAENRAKQYTMDMKAVKADKTPIDFKPIEQRFFDIVDSMYSGTHQVAADETIAKLNKIQDVLAEWSADPTMHTAGGLDALKRRIDNLMPSFSDANVGDTERAITAVRNAVKDAVVEAAPQYKKAMEGYESSKATQREIERSLSLNRDAAADTALRKLQSLTRNNVNTNYGSRVKSADVLKDAGAETLMPRLAGQALNAKMPRGIMQAVAGASLLGGQFVNPLFWAMAPLTSPRLVGEAANLAGTASRYAKKIPTLSREQLLLLQQAGRVGLLGQ